MKGNDFMEYLELANDYAASLSSLHQALLKCDIRRINSLTDDLIAIEHGVILMMSDFESVGAYDAEKSELSRESLVTHMPTMENQIDRFFDAMQEAKATSQALGVLREEIEVFYSEVGALPENTYGNKNKR